jgi:hypothetical protein
VVSHAQPAEAAVAEASQGYDIVMVGAGDLGGLIRKRLGLIPGVLAVRCPVSLLLVRQYAPRQDRALAAPSVGPKRSSI